MMSAREKRERVMKNHNKGFTLIETMITVAIISILSIVAIPAYQIYEGRAQLAEALNLMSGAKIKYAEFIMNNGRLSQGDEGLTILGASYSGKYVSQVYLSTDGKIGATMNSNAVKGIQNTDLALIPDISSGNIKWTCIYYGSAIYAPSSCR